MKESNVSQWYSKVKRMAGELSPSLSSDNCVEELESLSDQAQAEKISDYYATISSEYQPIKSEDFPDYKAGEYKPPRISTSKVVKVIKSMNKQAAAVSGDLPRKIIDKFCDELSRPLAHLINSCLTMGQYPKIWKVVFHHMSSSTKGRLPLKVVFHRKLSSTEGRLPPKVVFHQRLSSNRGYLPPKVVFH